MQNKTDARDVCKSKVRHDSESSAKTTIHQTGMEGLMDYYECKVCRGFHLTSLPEKKKIRPRQMKINRETKNFVRKMKLNRNDKNDKKK